jgi:serine/threonine protein kinase
VNPELWHQVERLYHSALCHEPGERNAFLDEACKGDQTLRGAVESLLAEDVISGVSASDVPSPSLDPLSPDDTSVTPRASGKHLGPYQIEGPLGAGGMGEVFRARDTRLGRTVALKVLPHDKMADPDCRHRFLQEARVVSTLNHPHIVTLFDIANDHGVDFLVLEYVPGKTLKQLVPSGGVPLAEVVRYGVQIAQALGAAHGAGIVHRDIKPANIIVTPDSHVKVLDFGVAKLMERVAPGLEMETRTLGEMA